MFYHACRAGGCSPRQARLLYAGVRIGAWAERALDADALSAERQLLRAPPAEPNEEELFLRNTFTAIAHEMEPLADELSIDDIDELIAHHLA